MARMCLRGTVAIVTSASDLLGGEHDTTLVGVGAKVVVCEINADTGQPVPEETNESGAEDRWL